jgi:serine/threonine protein phosphatase 1
MLLNAVSRGEEAQNIWFGNGGWATLQQFGVKKPTDIPQDYIKFLSMLPTVLTTEDYVLVHAGLHFGVADPINDTPDYFRLWDRDYKVAPELIGNRTLVVGHTKTDIHTIRNSLATHHTHHIKLDNGCYDKGHVGFGSLVALDLDSREIIEVRNCE